MIKSHFEQQHSCPLCNLATAQAKSLFSLQQMDMCVNVLECPVCGLAYKEYFPAAELLAEIYGTGYVHHKIEDHSKDKQSVLRLNRMGKVSGLKLLDYGCGSGQLVMRALACGSDSYGADPFLPDGLLDAKYNGRFLKYSALSGDILPNGPFDIISMWAVLEHLEHPRHILEGLLANLAHGGKLIFNVPNAHSMIARKKGANWQIALLIEHLVFFTKKTIHYIAKKYKLKVVTLKNCGTPYPLGAALPSMSSYGFRGYDESAVQQQPRSTAFLRRALSVAMPLIQSPHAGNFLRDILGVFGVGDHFFVILEK